MTTSRVIAVNRFYSPDESATAQLLADVANTLKDNGTPVLIVTSRLLYNDPSANLPARQTVNGVAVRRVWSSRFGRARLLGRGIDFLTFYVAAFAVLLQEATRDDTILAKTDPPLVSVVAAVVARLKGARLVNWCQDLYPELAAALGLGWARGTVGKILILARNWSLRQAAVNVVLCDAMRDVVAKQGVQAHKIRVVDNWACGAIRPMPRQPDGDFIITYSGNLGRAHIIETIIELMARTQALVGVTYRFVSAGAGVDAVRRAAQERRLRNLVFEPPAPLGQLGESLARADLHLVSLDPGCEGLMMPSKLYGVMAAGRPTLFLGSPDGAVARILRAHDAGITLDAARPETYLPKLQALIADADRLAAMGRNARHAFERVYNAARSLEAWQSVLCPPPTTPRFGLEGLSA